MREIPPRFPNLDTLTDGLRSVLCGPSEWRGGAVIDRQPNPWAGVMPSEIVRYARPEGREFVVLCKHETDRQSGHGEAGTVTYEAAVYSEVLRPLGISVATCYGMASGRGRSLGWLVVEYLSGCMRSDDPAVQEVALPAAASWLGARPASQKRNLVDIRQECSLCRYDAGIYADWMDRAIAVAGSLPEHRQWLLAARPGYLKLLDFLDAQPGVVIHGDYYADNILLRSGMVSPIDWAWAALAVGEIDLVTLTERWLREMVHRCERAYRAARWPAGAPGDFEVVRDVARLAVLFRWMGRDCEWSLDAERLWRFDAARELSQHLGII